MLVPGCSQTQKPYARTSKPRIRRCPHASSTLFSRSWKFGHELGPPVTALPLCATLTVPGQPRYVGRAREFVSIALGSGHPCADALTVIVSELVTNAVVHSRSGRDGGTVTVRLRPSPGPGDGLGGQRDRVRVEVTDDGADGLPALLPVGACDVGGRGFIWSTRSPRPGTARATRREPRRRGRR
jgi:anti-sigma regulatory factor (Ser/Thr protein kinase)